MDNDGYKKLTGFYEARWNLCREIKESGPVGTPSDGAVLFYLALSAWWRDAYQHKVTGEVALEHGSARAISCYTGVPLSTVYKSLRRLQLAGWIDAGEAGKGEIRVTVLLDDRARRDRAVRRAHFLKTRKTFSKRENDSQNEKDFLKTRIATVTDLRKHPSRNLGT